MWRLTGCQASESLREWSLIKWWNPNRSKLTKCQTSGSHGGVVSKHVKVLVGQDWTKAEQVDVLVNQD